MTTESKAELEKVKKINYINKIKRKIQELYQTSDDSEVPTKPEAEIGQREAGRPSNCSNRANPTVNRLQGGIGAVV